MPQATTKPTPPHVAIAQSAVQALNGHAEIETLRKLVPSLAARLYQTGQEVTADELVHAGAQGCDAVKKRIFSLKPSQSKPQVAAASIKFSSYVASGDFDDTALYPALLRSKGFQQCYETLRDLLAHEGHADSHTLASDAACLFAHPQRLSAYLDKWAVQGAQPVYDALQMIALPVSIKAMDMECWREAAIQHGPKMAALVHNADVQPKPVRSSCGHNWNYHDTRYAIIRKSATTVRANRDAQAQRPAAAAPSFFSATHELSQSFNTARPAPRQPVQSGSMQPVSHDQALLPTARLP